MCQSFEDVQCEYKYPLVRFTSANVMQACYGEAVVWEVETSERCSILGCYDDTVTARVRMNNRYITVPRRNM